MTAKLDKLVQEIEAQKVAYQGWATPGASAASAALDVARTVCRRAERRVCALEGEGQLHNTAIICFLNRPSGFCLARGGVGEGTGGGKSGGGGGGAAPLSA